MVISTNRKRTNLAFVVGGAESFASFASTIMVMQQIYIFLLLCFFFWIYFIEISSYIFSFGFSSQRFCFDVFSFGIFYHHGYVVRTFFYTSMFFLSDFLHRDFKLPHGLDLCSLMFQIYFLFSFNIQILFWLRVRLIGEKSIMEKLPNSFIIL